MTDRVVLDQKLQDTIYKFGHKQKFPFVSRQLLALVEARGAEPTGVR